VVASAGGLSGLKKFVRSTLDRSARIDANDVEGKLAERWEPIRFFGLQSVLPPVPRPEGGNTGRAETGGKDAARNCVTNAHPASPERTLSLRAEPRGAPSDMLPDHRLR
jgi:hypothetical protein